MAIVFVGQAALYMGSGLVKMEDIVGAICCSYYWDSMEPRMEG